METMAGGIRVTEASDRHSETGKGTTAHTRFKKKKKHSRRKNRSHPLSSLLRAHVSLPSRRRKSHPCRAAEAAAPEWYLEAAYGGAPSSSASSGAATTTTTTSSSVRLGAGEAALCGTCGTADTPMWRRSACGALMCNACGLRARRAAASAARGELMATLAAGGPAGGAAAAGLMTMSTRGASRRAPAIIGGTVILAPERAAAQAAKAMECETHCHALPAAFPIAAA